MRFNNLSFRKPHLVVGIIRSPLRFDGGFKTTVSPGRFDGREKQTFVVNLKRRAHSTKVGLDLLPIYGEPLVAASVGCLSKSQKNRNDSQRSVDSIT